MPIIKKACWAASLAVMLWCISPAPDARAEERWQYAGTSRVDIGGLSFAHSRPILYFSFFYRGTERTILAPSAIVGIDLETGKAITNVLPCGTPAADPVISPDDSYLAYRFTEGAHFIGLRRFADGEISVLPDDSPGIKYPNFFSPDSKTLTYLLGEDTNDIRTLRKGYFVVEYSLDTGKRNVWSLGVGTAWDLQRLSDDRIIFRAMEPRDREVLRRFARSEGEVSDLFYSILIYTFDKSTGTLNVDPINRLSARSESFASYIYRHLRTVQGTKGRRYYVVDNGYRAADLLAGDRSELRRVVRLGGEVWDFLVSDDEKWLAVVYTNIAKDSPYWRDREYDKTLEIRNMVTGETRWIDLHKPPFSDIANQQRSGCGEPPN